MANFVAARGPIRVAPPSSIPFGRRFAAPARRFSGLGEDPSAVARGQAAIDAARAALRQGGLAGFACLNCEKVMRVRQTAGLAGLGSLGLSYQSAAGGALTGAKVGSAIPVVGTAIGAAVGAIAGALFGKKKDPNAAEKSALKGQVDDYMKVMGSIPGRAFNLSTLIQLGDGMGYRGMWPNTRWSGGEAVTGAIDGCKKCTPPTIRKFVHDEVASGNLDPRAMAEKFSQHVQQTWGDKWMLTSAGPAQAQLITDIMDYFVAQEKPDAPLLYAPEWTVAANTPAPAPAPAPAPTPQVIAPTVQPSPVGTLVPLAGQAPDGSPLYKDSNGTLWLLRNGVPYLYQGPIVTAPATPPVQTAQPVPAPLPVQPVQPVQTPTANVQQTSTQPNVDVMALVKSLMQQGATQQQAFLSAMQNLQSQGVTATPQVQQQVANQVQAAGSGANIPSWLIPVLIGSAGLAIVIGMPKSKR